MKRYVLIAGVNGAGKSTLYDDLESLHSMKRVCLDEIVRQRGGDWKNFQDVFQAGKIAIERTQEYFRNGESFNQETTLCGKTILSNIYQAKKLGYFIEIHFIGLESADIAKERVKHRVEKGGHGINGKDIERRYDQSIKNLQLIIPICDQVIVYDNSLQFVRIAIYQHGELQAQAPVLPGWYKENIRKDRGSTGSA